MATQVNQKLDSRFKLLSKVAKIVGPAILGEPAALQTLLKNRPALQEFFNGGYIAYRRDGTALAAVPQSGGRVGLNDMDVDAVAAALTQGKTTLGRPNFLSKITENRYGKPGDYFLVAPQYRLMLASSEKSRFMTALAAPGSNPLLDRFIQGYEGSGVVVSPQGMEELSSAKGVPIAGWYMVARLPTAESFAPIRAMQQRLLQTTLLLTLLAGALTWWLLRRQLLPLLVAAKALASLSDTHPPAQPLPIARQDEIGQLIGGFNRLLKTLGQREEALQESESHLRTIIENEPECIKIVDAQGYLIQMNPAGLAMIEADSLAQVAGLAVLDLIAPEYRQAFSAGHQRVLAGESIQMEFEVLGLKGGRRWMATHAVPMPYKGQVAQLAVTHDITERKQAEENSISPPASSPMPEKAS